MVLGGYRKAKPLPPSDYLVHLSVTCLGSLFPLPLKGETFESAVKRGG
jgi:hypothetical protein